jgi:hypothetical protein
MSVQSLACPLARALGLGHRAVVEQSPKDAADDRPEHVKPHTSEVPATIIGPSERAGLTDPPVTGPAMNTPTASANPTAIGAIAAGALRSVATAITTKTSMKVIRISTTKACKSPPPVRDRWPQA